MPRVFLACVLISAAGCRPVMLAGDTLGEFAVHGVLEATSCGAGYAVPAELTYRVEVRREPGSSYGYWKLADGPLVSGAVRPDSTFRFEDRQVLEAFPADPDTGAPGCTLDRTEIVTGAITDAPDAGAPFTAATTIVLAPSAGTYCAPLLTLYGGTFPELPCRIDYALEGERTSF